MSEITEVHECPRCLTSQWISWPNPKLSRTPGYNPNKLSCPVCGQRMKFKELRTARNADLSVSAQLSSEGRTRLDKLKAPK